MLSRHWFLLYWEVSWCTRTFGFIYYRNTFSIPQWASQGPNLGLFLLSLISCFRLAHSNYLEPSGHWPSSSLSPNSRSSFHSVSSQPLINKALWRGPRLGLCFGLKCSLKSCTGRKYSGLQHVHRLCSNVPQPSLTPIWPHPQGTHILKSHFEISSYPASPTLGPFLLTVVSQEQGLGTQFFFSTS